MKDMATCIGADVRTAAVGGADGSATFDDIDRLDFESLTLVLQIPSDANVAAAIFYDLTVLHSDDGDTYTACAATDLIAQDGAALTVAAGKISSAAYVFDDGTNGVDVRSAAATVRLGYRGDKRFVRLVVNENGAAAGGTAVLAAIKGHSRYAPVAA